MVSTRRTASSLSAQAADNAAADDGTTGAESRLTPTPAERPTKASVPVTAAKSKTNAASSPPRRRLATALQPVPEQADEGETCATNQTSSSSRKIAQARGKKPTLTKKSKAAAASAPAVAAAADSSSSDDEPDDDGLACLAQGMLDALCGLPGGKKRGGDASGSESESEDDAIDLPPPSTPNVENENDNSDGASSSSDSDSEGSDDDERNQTAAPLNISWAPSSLRLPRPASATPAIELLAEKATRKEERATSSSSVLALPRLSRKNKSEATTAAPAPARRSSWFDLPTQTLTPELKTDLRLLRLRGAMDPTRHYKSEDTKKLPSRFHVGTVVESKTDFYSSRLSRSERGQTLTRELLKDPKLSAQRKRRFGALQEAAAARGHKGGGGKGARARKTSMPRLKKHRVRPKH